MSGLSVRTVPTTQRQEFDAPGITAISRGSRSAPTDTAAIHLHPERDASPMDLLRLLLAPLRGADVFLTSPKVRFATSG